MSRDYFNRMANRWDETSSEKDGQKLQQMIQDWNIPTGAAVLDVGTGTGVLLPFLWAKMCESGNLVALDFAEVMLETAKAKKLSGNIEYVCADIVSVPKPDASFDVVVCYSCFPHFRDKLKSLREISRLLKNGGSLFICHTSSRVKINSVHRQVAALCQDLIPEAEEMRQLLMAAGFTDIQIRDAETGYLATAKKPSALFNAKIG